MMAYRHGFLVSVFYLIFLLDIHSAALKFAPVFYKSTHLPIIQFSWHGPGSSGYTKQGYFSAQTWIFEHWSFDICIWLNCCVPRDSRSLSETNYLALATMDSVWSSFHRCGQRRKRPRYYKMPVVYYSNSIATQRLLILSGGDISVNPGPAQTVASSTQKSKQKTNSKRNIMKCDCCEKTIRRNQASITCCVCIGFFHLKCSGLTASSSTWLCSNCLGSALPFYKCSDAEMLDDTLDLSASLDSGLDIHPLCFNSGQLKIMHLNTQSMVSTFNELLLTVNSYPLDIVALSETWLRDQPQLLYYVSIPGFVTDFRNREGIRGGGVGVYIKENINYKRRRDIENAHPELEHLWIEVPGRK